MARRPMAESTPWALQPPFLRHSPFRLPLRPWLPYAFAALLLVALQRGGVTETVNLLLHDIATQLRPAPDGAATPVRVIGINEPDLRRLGWPIDDDLLSEAIRRLERAGVRAIGLDLFRDIGVGNKPGRLRALAASDPRLVSVFSAVDGIGVIPGTPPQRRAYNDVLVDPDGVVRRDLVHVRGQGPHMVALPMRLLEVASGDDRLRRALERDPAAVPHLGENSGGYSHFDHGGVQRMLAFQRPGSIPTWSLSQLLADEVPEASLRNAIVLIGNAAPSLRDGFRVPFGRIGQGQALRMPGVEVHAHRLAALLALEAGRPIGLRVAPGWLNSLLLVAGIGIGIGLGEGVRTLSRSQLAVAVAGGVVVLASGVALAQGFWFDAALPLAGLGVMASAAWIRRAGEQQRQREQLLQLLRQTTSPAVARELWRQRDVLLEGGRFPGRTTEVTVLFTDIERFTGVAELLDPHTLLNWLNRGMAAMVGPVEDEGGLVNKFTGDGLLAVFGAPLGRGPAVDAAAAVRAASGIRRAVMALNANLAEEGLPAMQLRVGVHSGRVLTGSVGTPNRWEFGVVGDTVNCAARIEALDMGSTIAPFCRVLISDSTRALVGETVQGRWFCWGKRALSGRSSAVEIWELMEGPEPEALEASSGSQRTGS